MKNELSKFSADELKEELKKREVLALKKEYTRRNEIINFVKCHKVIFNKLMELVGSSRNDVGEDFEDLSPEYEVHFYLEQDPDFLHKCFEKDGKFVWEKYEEIPETK